MTSAIGRFPLRRVALLAVLTTLCGAAPAAAVCVGDCNGDGRVSIAELQNCVNLANDLAAPPCAAADRDNDGTVGANEVDLCVQSFLDADTCPMVFTPAPTATRTGTNTPVPSATNTPPPPATSTRTSTPTPSSTPPPSPTVTSTPFTIGASTCTLDTAPLLCVGGPFNGLTCTNSADCAPGGFCATAASKLDLRLAAAAFELPASGAVNIACGSTDPSGKAACTCDIDTFDPVLLPGLGTICVNPVAGCPAGEIDCDGGNSLDVETRADHNIGACISNAACAAACDSFCDGLGATYDPMSSGCEGFCDGGANDEMACTADTDCPGGSCPGKDPVTHAGVCGCVCGGTGLGGASVPGGLSCNLGVQIDVVVGGPCGDPPTIVLNPMCGPMSTGTATSRIFDQGNTMGSNIPGPGPLMQTGAAIDCNTLATSTTTGLRLVGGLGFFDSTLGDILSGQTLICK